jgi:hypothetical protein
MNIAARRRFYGARGKSAACCDRGRSHSAGDSLKLPWQVFPNLLSFKQLRLAGNGYKNILKYFVKNGCFYEMICYSVV